MRMHKPKQVGYVSAAAAALEAATFEPNSLNEVAARTDALGQLARVFQQMAREVRAREERLKQQVQEWRIVIDEASQAKKVAEITESDYFRRLRGQADQLRSIKAMCRLLFGLLGRLSCDLAEQASRSSRQREWANRSHRALQ
jgi:DNA repair ATPase RecN